MKEGFRLYLHHTAIGGNGLCTDLQPAISFARKAGRITLLGDAVCVCVCGSRRCERGGSLEDWSCAHLAVSGFTAALQRLGKRGQLFQNPAHIYTHAHSRAHTHTQSPYCPWRAIGKGRSANCTRDWLRWESQSRSPLCVCVCVCVWLCIGAEQTCCHTDHF